MLTDNMTHLKYQSWQIQSFMATLTWFLEEER